MDKTMTAIINTYTKIQKNNYIEKIYNSNIDMIYIPKKSVFLGKYPITQYQYSQVMNQNPSHFKGGLQLPVERVSWYDAMDFCNKLSEKTGKNYTLPTEVQWEYCCRAGTKTEFPWGDNETKLGEYAWYYNNSKEGVHPVGLKRPNEWGFHDMLGNVWEWCLDGDNGNKTIRGGSWTCNPNGCRPAFRFGGTPTFQNYSFGFRLSRTF